MALNIKQQRAQRAQGHTRIIAGPGTGKTTLLIARCEHLLKDPKARLGLVTFATAAADEMRQRLNDGCSSKRVTVSTFDALARQQVMSTIRGRRPPRAFEKRLLIQKTMAHLGSDMNEDQASELIQRLDTYLKPESESDNELELEFYDTYRGFLEQDGLMDFCEIARLAVTKMADGEIPCLGVTHLLVDEFQDTSPIQMEWLQAHWEAGVEITTVGDDDQSIFGFRQAMGYPGMEIFGLSTGASDFVLDGCYRCAPEIISAANALIANNRERLPKQIQSLTAPGGKVRHWVFESDEHEFVALNAFIQNATEHGPEKTIAILARNNYVLDAVEAQLRIAGVHLRRVGGRSIWDKPGGSLMLNLVELATQSGPNRLGTLMTVLRWAHAGEAVMNDYRDYISANGWFAGLPETAQKDRVIHHFADVFTTWASMIHEGLAEPALDCMQDWIDANCRTNEESKVSKLAAQSLRPRAGQSLRARMAQIQQSQSRGKNAPDTPLVELITMHGSKGCEWESVWITGAREGVVPSKPSLMSEFDGDLLVIEEERRLFYVATTRAKRVLVIAATQTSPSRFCAETQLRALVHPKNHAERLWGSETCQQ